MEISIDQITQSLNNKEFIPRDCVEAIRGTRFPGSLGNRTARLCTIRGIRYHAAFAAAAGLLHSLPDFPEFTRALNARSIMSNRIPNITKPEHFPYCIWHPEVASEATYRTLAARYPQLKYNVGRAAVVAGYHDLYHELDLLPEVSIAEEARNNKKTGGPIFDAIMAQKLKYSIMDDYNLTVNIENPRAGAFLNADTAVYSSLENRQTFGDHENFYIDRKGGYFDITEDMSVDEKSSGDEHHMMGPKEASQLYNPLPPDLSSHHKDVLILMAAYHGDLDRYIRLRRPKPLDSEKICIIRGIYHNTFFAKYWSLQPSSYLNDGIIQAAVTARFIMNNDLSRVMDGQSDKRVPYLIHYPSWASSYTYERLSQLKPSMKPQIARAAIVKDDQGLFDCLNVKPDFALVREARASPNPYYLKNLLSRAKTMSIDVLQTPMSEWYQYWKVTSRADAMEETTTFLHNKISVDSVQDNYQVRGIYDGERVDIGQIELFVCSPDSMKPEGPDFVDLADMYHEASNPGEELSKLLKD